MTHTDDRPPPELTARSSSPSVGPESRPEAPRTSDEQTLRLHLEHFRRRVLTDALQEGTTAYWIRRAEAFEAAVERPGDHLGQTTDPERDARATRLVETAIACRHHAQLVHDTGLDDAAQAVIDQILYERHGQVT